jgi:general secretion pathway protein D
MLVMVSLLGIAALEDAQAQSSSPDEFTLNLKNVDIYSLIETVSRHTGKNFIVDPRVKATVTVVSSEPVNAKKLHALFLSVLEVHGFAEVAAGNVFKIVPVQTGVQSAVPLFNEQSDSGAGLITKIIPVKHIPALQLAETLRPLLPATASFNAEASSNTVVITDNAANVKRVVNLINQLDRPN